MTSGSCLVFVGTLTQDVPHFAARGGQGIHVLRLDYGSGELKPLSVSRGVENPNYLAFDAERNALYAASEMMDWPEGKITQLNFDPATFELSPGDAQSSLGHLSCFLSLDSARRHLLVANYSMLPAGSEPDRAFAVLPIAGGRVGPASSSIRRRGNGPNAARQERSHPHCIIPLPDGRLVATDLGTDELLLFNLNRAAGLITAQPVASVVLPPGSGPRHVVASASGHRLYVVQEMACSVAVLDAIGDSFAISQILPILPDGAQTADSAAAAIQLSPCGRFVFASNRWPDRVSLLRQDDSTGELRLAGIWPTGGRTPRSMALSPNGRFLIIGNQDSGTVNVFAVDPDSGELSPTSHIALSAPMCVVTASEAIARLKE